MLAILDALDDLWIDFSAADPLAGAVTVALLLALAITVAVWPLSESGPA